MDSDLGNIPPFQARQPPKEVDPPRQRIDVACSRCRRRKIKCSGWTEEQPRCLGCIKAEHPCEFVNRVTPIAVPPNSAPGSIASSTGYSRPWSPTTPTSPRGYGSMSAGHRRSTQGYHPYAPQPSPTGLVYSPSYVVAPWMQQQSPQEIADSYAGTGFHHLLDPSPSVARQARTDGGMDSPNMTVQSSLAQRRLQRGESYTYGDQMSPLPSPITIPVGQPSRGYSSPSLLPKEEPYGKLMYAPLHVASNPQLQSSMVASSLHSTQIQKQTQAHVSQKPVNFSPMSSSTSSQSFPTPSPQSQTAQSQFPEHTQSQQPRVQYQDPQQSRMQYQDPQRMQYQEQSRMHYQEPRQQYPQDPRIAHQQYSSPEFVIPNNPRRPHMTEASTQSSSSTSVLTYSTTQSHQSTQSSSVEYPTSGVAAYPPHPADLYPSPYKPEPRNASRPGSRRDDQASLTPQTLADHTHVQESIHEQHIDEAKNVLAVDNGNDVQVIEYLDALPQPQQQAQQGDD